MTPQCICQLVPARRPTLHRVKHPVPTSRSFDLSRPPGLPRPRHWHRPASVETGFVRPVVQSSTWCLLRHSRTYRYAWWADDTSDDNRRNIELEPDNSRAETKIVDSRRYFPVTEQQHQHNCVSTSIMPNTHRQRRRDETVESRHSACEHTRR